MSFSLVIYIHELLKQAARNLSQNGPQVLLHMMLRQDCMQRSPSVEAQLTPDAQEHAKQEHVFRGSGQLRALLNEAPFLIELTGLGY